MAPQAEYVEQMQAQLGRYNAELQHLEVQLHLGAAPARDELEERLGDLRQLRALATVKLQRLQDAREAAWQDLRAGTESALNTLGDAIDSARLHLSDQQ